MPAQFKKNIDIPAHLKPAGKHTSELLKEERAGASVDSEKLKRYLYSEEYLQRQAKMVQLLESDTSGVFDKTNRNYVGRAEFFTMALEKDKKLNKMAVEGNWSTQDMTLAEWLIDQHGPTGLHKNMFLPTLYNQGTDEQRKLFWEPASRYEISGCYAQTELGHGSNLAGIETTATYDPKTREFVLHSPSLTASKWWIGGLGRGADHAVVMAQLYTNGEHYGPHPFVVPIRDIKTREPLPGRTIGDIGPKVGLKGNDNGFLLLDNVRVPHVNFLARFQQIDPATGAYHKPKNERLKYGTLTLIRAGIVENASKTLARAATVAIRYCAMRRQFADKDEPQKDSNGRQIELQVIDYPTVQTRLFPALVRAFAFHFTGAEMRRLYWASQDLVAKGDVSLVPELHAASCGLKSVASLTTADSIEVCRRACGGHGYSLASGLGTFYQDYLPTATWEGDSYMIVQQCSRYLIKTYKQLKENPNMQLNPENAVKDYLLPYLRNPKAKAPPLSSAQDKAQWFLAAFGFRAAHVMDMTEKKLRNRKWNESLIDLKRLSDAHCEYLLVRNFARALKQDDRLNALPAEKRALELCFELYSTYQLDISAADFLSSGYISPEQYLELQDSLTPLLAAVRPDAVALVDAFGIPDYLLDSALGASDGMVYERLFDYAVREPLNALKPNPNFRDPRNYVPPLAKL